MQSLRERIVEAVRRGVDARAQFYAAIDLEDEQLLGAPASEEAVQRLERWCARVLPPSYLTFLRLHDGWRMVDGGCDLLPVDRMLSGPTADKVRKWQSAMASEQAHALAAGLVIGFSEISQKRIVLDLSRPGPEGECALIQWDSDEWIEYPTFVEWLEMSAQEFEDLAQDSADDQA